MRDIHLFGVMVGDLIGRQPQETVFVDSGGWKYGGKYEGLRDEYGEGAYFQGQYMELQADGTWARNEDSFSAAAREKRNKQKKEANRL